MALIIPQVSEMPAARDDRVVVVDVGAKRRSRKVVVVESPRSQRRSMVSVMSYVSR